MPSVTVGVDGTLFRHHEKFRDNLSRTLSRLVPRAVSEIYVLMSESHRCLFLLLASFGSVGRWFI